MATLYFEVGANYDAVIRLKNEIDQLKRQLSNANFSTPVEQLCQRLQQAQQEMGKLLGQAATSGREISELAKTMNNVGGQKMASGLRDTSSALRSFSGEVKNTEMGLGMMIRQFSAAGMAIAGLRTAYMKLRQAMGTIVNFEQANQTLKAITGSSEEELEALRTTALNLGRATVFTASDVTQLETALAKLGFRTEDIINMSKGVLDFAQSTGANLEDAATTAGAALRMFGAESTETTKYVSAMSAATRMSALDFRMISDNLATFGPMAKSMGMGIEDVLALFGKLKDQGIEASTAMTSLRNIFTKVAQGKIEGMGKVNGLDDFIEGLNNAMSTYQGNVAAAMKAIGPRGGTQFMSLLTAFNKKEFDETSGQVVDSITNLRNRIKAEMQDSSGLDTMSETVNNSVAGAMKRVSSAWEGLVLSFSGSTGVIGDAVDKIAVIMNKLNDAMTNKTGMFDPETMATMITTLKNLIEVVVAYKMQTLALTTIEEYHMFLRKGIATAYNNAKIAVDSYMASENALITTELQQMVTEGKLTAEQAMQIAQLEAKVIAIKENIATEAAAIAEEEANIVALGEETTAENAETIALKRQNLERRKALLLQNQSKIAALDTAIANVKAATTTGMWATALNSLKSALKACWPMLLIFAGIKIGEYIFDALGATEKAAESAKKTAEAGTMAAQQYNSELEGLIHTIRDETKSVQEKTKAYDELIKKYKEFDGMSMSDVAGMSERDLQNKVNQLERTSELKALQRQKDMWAEVSGDEVVEQNEFGQRKLKKNSRKGTTDKKELQKRFEQLGATQDEIDKFFEELDKVPTLESSGVYAHNVQAGLLDKISAVKENTVGETVNSMLAYGENDIKAYYDGMAKLGVNADKANSKLKGVVDTTAKLFDKTFSDKKIKRFNEKLGKEYVSTIPAKDIYEREYKTLGIPSKEDIQKQISDLNKEKNTLYAEWQNEKDDKKKTQIKLELDDVSHTKEFLENLSSMYKDGKLDYETYITIQTKFEGTDGMDADMTKAFNSVFTQSDKALEELVNKMHQAGDDQEKVSKIIEETEKAMKKPYEEASAKVDEYKKKLEDKTLTEPERKEISLKLGKAEQVKREIEQIMQTVSSIVSEPQHLQLIIDYLNGGSTPEIPSLVNNNQGWKLGGGNQSQWNQSNYVQQNTNTPMGVPFNARGGSMRPAVAKAMEHINTDEEEEQKKIEKENKKDALKQSRDKAKKIRDAQHAYNDAIKKQQETYDKDMLDLTRKREDAELAIIKEGSIKQLQEMRTRHQREVEDLKKTKEEKVKAREKEVQALWDKQEAINQANATRIEIGDKGKAKTVNDYVKRDWRDLNDEQKKSFVEKVNKKNPSLNLRMGLSTEEIEEYDKQMSAVIAKQTKEEKEFADKRREGVVKFLQDFGTAEEKRAAIVEEYQKKINDAIEGGDQTEANRAIMELQKTLKDFDDEQLKETFNWDALFGNLQDKTTERLRYIREQLVKMLDVKDISAENAKAIAEQLDKVDEMLRSKGNVWRELFGNVFSGVFERRELRRERDTKEEQYRKAQQKTTEKTNEYNLQESLLRMRLGGKVSSTDNLLDSKVQNKIMDGIGEEERKSLMSAFANLTKADKNKKDAQKEEKEAKEDSDNANMALGGVAGMSPLAMIGLAATNMASMGKLAESLTIDEESPLGKAMYGIAEVGSGLSDTVGALQSGDFIGAAAGMVDTLVSLGSLFGANMGNMEKMNKEIEKLNATNATLIAALEDVKEALQESTIFNVGEEYDKAVKLFEAAQKNASRVMIDESRKWERGSHSVSYQVSRDKEFKTLLGQVNGILNTNLQNSADFLRLSADQMKQLRETDADLFNDILQKYRDKENKHTGSGVDELIQQYIDDFANGMDELNQMLYEKVTGVSFDQLFDNFKNTLKDMNASARDFAKSTEDLLNGIQIDVMADKYKEELKTAYEQFAQSVSDNNGATPAAIEKYREATKRIADEALKARDALMDAGLLNTTYDQDFSKGVGSMTEETADELNGRMTMVQVTAEAARLELSSQTSILTTIKDSIIDMSARLFNTEVFSETMAAYMLEVQSMNQSFTTMNKRFDEMRDLMSSVKTNTERI